jgi:sulfate transport system ATP-binding protein
VRERQVGFVFSTTRCFIRVVNENVAFGLKIDAQPAPSDADIKKKMHDLLGLVQLDWLADRFPSVGGQRQPGARAGGGAQSAAARRTFWR